MAPLPPNNTAVYFLDYSVASHNHTVQCRFGSGGSVGDAGAFMDAFLTAFGTELYLITVIGARVRDQGSDVTYPVTWDGAATYGSDVGPEYASAQFADFIGRSIDGRRARIEMFGLKNIIDGSNNDFRKSSAVTWVGAVLAVLGASSDVPVSISGEPVNWHDYVNTGINAYWRNHIRA